MRGQVAVLTGSTGAIGLETAVGLARAGFTTALVARDLRKGAATARLARDRVGASCPELPVFQADLARQSDVRRVAGELGAALGGIRVLVHNAGVVTNRRVLSEDGIDMQLAVNAVAPFLLTGLLLPQLAAAAPSRVIVVASRAAYQGVLDLDDLDLRNGYDPLAAYERSKLAATLFAYEAARRLSGRGIAVNAVHPGVVDSTLLRAFGVALRRRRNAAAGPYTRVRSTLSALRQSARRLLTPGRVAPGTIPAEEGARTTVWAASAPELEGVTGAWFEARRVGRSEGATHDRTLARQFWEAAERLTGSTTGTRCW